MKFSGDAREIDLRLAARNGDAVIEVADRGLGIALEEQKHVFQKFYRAPSHEDPPDRRNRLGAHPCGAHRQGPWWVRGSPQRPRRGQHVFHPDPTGGAGMTTILTIKDDPAILRGLSDNLRIEGYNVLIASDGETGYQLQRERKPDLIVLDLMLPRMSGYELCRKLRGEGIQTPILMLTARSEEPDRVLGL